MRLALALSLLAFAAACSRGDGRVEPPLLAETARFDSALASAGPDAERLADGADALAARAEALRARADAMAGPVVADDRLEAAVP